MPLTPEQQQDNYTLSFLDWIQKTYVYCANDEYVFNGESDIPFVDREGKSSAECLKQFKALHPSPVLQYTPASAAIADSLEKCLKFNWVIMKTLNQVQNLLFQDEAATVSKTDIHLIIKEGLDAIVSPANS